MECLALNWGAVVILFGVCSSSLICRFMSLVQFGKLLAIISLSTFIAPPSFSPVTQMLDLLL